MTTTRSRDRARGALLGSAVGDALGAGYEFGTAPLPTTGPEMIGGGLGGVAPGEWTDDTTMAWCIADVSARGMDLRSADGLTAVARNFRTWFETGPSDIGIQTAQVLRSAGRAPTGAAMRAAARTLADAGRRTGGNGSLMRTGPVALAYLDDPVACAEAARAVSDLTHADPTAGDACVLWTAAIRHAVLHGELDVRAGMELLGPEARETWAGLIDRAEAGDPGEFTPNGYVVWALQAAWSAIHHTAIPAPDPGSGPDQGPEPGQCPDAGADPGAGEAHVRAALATVIAIGDDTDTTAAIAGALLGARWGASAIPAVWRSLCHGYPGITAEDLVALADRTVDQCD